jgi:hypothetical protein
MPPKKEYASNFFDTRIIDKPQHSAPTHDNFFEEYLQQVKITRADVIKAIVRHDASEAFNKFLPDTFFYMMDPHSHIFDRSIVVNNVPLNDIIFQIVDSKKTQIQEVMYHIVKYIHDENEKIYSYLNDWIYNKKQFY